MMKKKKGKTMQDVYPFLSDANLFFKKTGFFFVFLCVFLIFCVDDVRRQFCFDFDFERFYHLYLHFKKLQKYLY